MRAMSGRTTSVPVLTTKAPHLQKSSFDRLDKWLVLLAAFVCQFFSTGFGNSLGVFFVEFLESFQASRVVVGWATSICSGLVFGAGLVGGLVVQNIGPRKATAVGSIVAFFGLLIASFAPHIAVIYLAFGVLTGCGCCLVCVSSFVAVSEHFEKGRGSASSLAVVGSGLGGLLLPIILRPIIDEYGWRGAMMILSALMLNVLPAAGLFAPPIQKTTRSHDHLKKFRLRTALCSRSLWSNAAFTCYLLICPVISIGYQYAFIVVVDIGILNGHNKALSTMLLTYMNLAITLSTLCFGCILRLVLHHRVLLFNISLVSMSIVMLMFSYVTSYLGLVAMTAAYGLAFGGLNALYAVIIVDLVGLKKYSTGLGLVCTGYGVGYLLSAPAAGALIDSTGSYNMSFYVASSLCFGSAILFAVIRFIRVRQERAAVARLKIRSIS